MAVNLQTEYLHSLDPGRLKKEIDLAVKSLRSVKFDSIAFTGVSGALAAPAIAARLKKGLIVVRKKEYAHSRYTVEGHRLYTKQRYIIIDDFPASGRTVKNIQKAIDRFLNPRAECVGVYFYSSYHINFILSRVDLLKWKATFKARIIPRYRKRKAK